jgi:hypothetical protein
MNEQLTKRASNAVFLASGHRLLTKMGILHKKQYLFVDNIWQQIFFIPN